MLDKQQARSIFEDNFPDDKVEAMVRYGDLYLVRVSRAEAAERDYDPFFSIDVLTGQIEDFSIITDGDINEIAKLFLAERG